MAFIAPLVAAAAPALSLVGTAVSALGAAQAGNYQSGILTRQATRDSWNGQIEVQDQGLSAAQQIGQATAQQGASGFSLASPSAVRRQTMLRALATRDAGRLAADAQTRSANTLAEAAQARRSANFALLEGAFGLGTDLINNATMVSKRRADSLNYNSRDVAYG